MDRTTLILKIDDIICKMYNLYVGFLYCFKKNPLLKRNSILQDEHNNKCYIIGNGPSLNDVDIKLIEKCDTFTLNGFYNSSLDFKSKYHMCIDPSYSTTKNDAHLKKLLIKNPNVTLITSINCYEHILDFGFKKENIFCIDNKLKPTFDSIRIDMCKVMTSSLNILPVAIECALFMGYKNIILVGCDFNFYINSNKGYHFYSEELKEEIIIKRDFNNLKTFGFSNLINCALVHKHHYILSKYAYINKINILNATNGSLIDSYKFISFGESIKI